MLFFSYKEVQTKPDRLLYYDQPNYAPNVVNQTVSYGGATWKGNPGTSWTLQSTPEQDSYNAAQKAITDHLAQQTTDFNNLKTQGQSDVTDFLGRYKAAVPGIISSTSDKYNLPGQTNYVNALNTRIKTLTGNLDNSGAGGYASGNQVDKAVNSRYLPLYEAGVTNLGTSTTQAQNEETQLIQPYQTEGQMLNDRLAREMTGFTTEQQTELTALIGQLNAGEQLTATQLTNANDLAKAQLAYKQAIDSATISNNKPQQVTPGSYIYDPASGKYTKVG